MTYEVLLTAGAERDLEAIYDYIAEYDSPTNAAQVLEGIAETLSSLAHLPERGTYPPELAALGIREYRQVLFKPYRLIYRVADPHKVVIHLIADGRRDFQSLLARRLLEG